MYSGHSGASFKMAAQEGKNVSIHCRKVEVIKFPRAGIGSDHGTINVAIKKATSMNYDLINMYP